MNLRGQAKSDLSFTLQGGENGFGLPVIIEKGSDVIGNDPNNPFFGQVSRISFLIDPDTGQPVNGDFVSVVVNLEEMKLAGFDVETRTLTKGDFRISAPDIDGTIQALVNKSFEPDNALGIIRFICSNLNIDNSVNEAILIQILQGIGVVS